MTLTEGTSLLGRDALNSASSGLGMVASLVVRIFKRRGGDAEVDFTLVVLELFTICLDGCGNFGESRVGGLSTSATETIKKRMISPAIY